MAYSFDGLHLAHFFNFHCMMTRVAGRRILGRRIVWYFCCRARSVLEVLIRILHWNLLHGELDFVAARCVKLTF